MYRCQPDDYEGSLFILKNYSNYLQKGHSRLLLGIAHFPDVIKGRLAVAARGFQHI